MLWHLVAVVFAGLGSAGVALLLRALSKKRLPAWIIPVFAGAGMLAYQIYFEYAWFEHKQQQLPPGTLVVASESGRVFWRPWTLVYPMTTAFSVVDTGNVSQAEIAGATIVRFVAYRFEKQVVDRVTYQRYLLNCTTTEQVPLSSDGVPDTSRIQTLPATDKLLVSLCRATR
jgi:hypothetical protein